MKLDFVIAFIMAITAEALNSEGVANDPALLLSLAQWLEKEELLSISKPLLRTPMLAACDVVFPVASLCR